MCTGTVEIKLENPIQWEDRTIEVINLDFSKVNVKAIKEAEQKCKRNYSTGIDRAGSSEYCAALAAIISGVPDKALDKLSYDDFDYIWQSVGAYILKLDPQKFYDQYKKSVEGIKSENLLDDTGDSSFLEKTGVPV